MNIRALSLLCVLFSYTHSIAQIPPAVLAASEKVVVGDADTHAEMANTAWGGSHGIFFGSKINYTGSDNLWHGGNAVYSNGPGAYNFGAFSLGYIANGGTFGFYDGGVSTGANQPISWATVMAMTRGGNVGIATDLPAARLHVNGDTRINTYLRVGSMPASTNGQFRILGHEGIGAVDLNNKTAYLWSQNGVCAVSAYDYSANAAMPLHINLEQTTTFINSSGGQVLIGAAGGLPAGYKLGVGGAVIAEKVKVKLQPWPDYVFEKDYQLPTLQEIEAFIQKNKHLPGILPAAVIEKEGLDLGSNQADLLKKIEELTLYLIDQDKRIARSAEQEKDFTVKIEKQQQQLDQQQKELDLLKNQMQALLNK